MTDAEQQLRRIGFGARRSEAACWRVVRLDPPVFPSRGSDHPVEPACSRDLLRWRRLLRRAPGSSAYRISRA